jgi:hypothetical protein
MFDFVKKIMLLQFAVMRVDTGHLFHANMMLEVPTAMPLNP